MGGPDETPEALRIDPEIVTFLNRRSRTVMRVWSNPSTGLAVAVRLTRYPYDIFAAAALAAADDDPDILIRSFAGTEEIPDLVAFIGQGSKEGQAGAVLRRGDLSILVLARAGNGGIEEAAAAVVDLTRQLHATLPVGATTPYEFPSPPSTLAGLALTAGVVTVAGAASIGVGRARAWTLRRGTT